MTQNGNAFFDAANLKNTITGEPICSREDFYKWHKQYSEAKAERERQTKSEAAKPTVEKPVANGPHSPNVHINYKWKGDIAFEVILEYAFKIDDLVSPCVPEKNADFSPYICIAALCAWSEVVLGAERKFVQYVVREVSSSYDLSAAENSAVLERLMYASADTVGFALEGKEQGQLFEYASDAIMRLLKLDPDVDMMVKIAFLLRDFTLEYAERRKGGI